MFIIMESHGIYNLYEIRPIASEVRWYCSVRSELTICRFSSPKFAQIPFGMLPLHLLFCFSRNHNTVKEATCLSPRIRICKLKFLRSQQLNTDKPMYSCAIISLASQTVIPSLISPKILPCFSHAVNESIRLSPWVHLSFAGYYFLL